MSSRGRRRDPSRDLEAAVTATKGPAESVLQEPEDRTRDISHPTQSKDKDLAVHDIQRDHTAAGANDHSPTRHNQAAPSFRPLSTPHLLSDDENARMNRKIDRLIAAIDDRRPIHFAPDATTGEVEIFSDHGVNHDEGDELEDLIAASPENFGRIIRVGNGVRRIRSVNSLCHAESSDSWASTNSERSSSNAWERAVAAANVRFSLAHGQDDPVMSVVRKPFRGMRIGNGGRRGRRLVRTVAPIPLDFNKPLRMSTPSIHSNGSEQDTSSPLFAKSCERILRETYTAPPESAFERESFPSHSRLVEWAFISEPRDVSSPKVRGKENAFGVFREEPIGELPSKEIGKSALPSKALKDISNLRRPGYLQFNSFSKDTKPTIGQTGVAVQAAAPPPGFGGAPNAGSRRAYIKKKSPGLLEDRRSGKMEEATRLDGAARRRNEQAVGSPIDPSFYSLTHARTSVADSSLNVNPIRQAHFDLALARLEGRALPPPPAPIDRHPDWAALHDCDIPTQSQESHRPLPLHGPAPSRAIDSTPLWGL